MDIHFEDFFQDNLKLFSYRNVMLMYYVYSAIVQISKVQVRQKVPAICKLYKCEDDILAHFTVLLHVAQDLDILRNHGKKSIEKMTKVFYNYKLS